MKLAEGTFYTMRASVTADTLVVRAEPSLGVDAERLLRGALVPTAPVGFKIFMGAKAGDWIVGGTTHLALLSERFITALQDLGATGWSSYPVVVADAKVGYLDGYRGLSVHGRCGPVLLSERVASIRRVGPGPPLRLWRGLPFDESTWDGSDIFMSSGPVTAVMVSRRVALEMNKLGLVGVAIAPTSEFASPI